jgi:hypothetical protein
MAQDVCIIVDAGDRVRLTVITADRNRPQKHVQRARIVLLSADRLPRRRGCPSGRGKPTVATIGQMVAVISRTVARPWGAAATMAMVDPRRPPGRDR